eukprot:1582028-Rhodomonas_salina.5
MAEVGCAEIAELSWRGTAELGSRAVLEGAPVAFGDVRVVDLLALAHDVVEHVRLEHTRVSDACVSGCAASRTASLNSSTASINSSTASINSSVDSVNGGTAQTWISGQSETERPVRMISKLVPPTW